MRYNKEGSQVREDALSSWLPENGYRAPLPSPDNLNTRAAEMRWQIID